MYAKLLLHGDPSFVGRAFEFVEEWIIVLVPSAETEFAVLHSRGNMLAHLLDFLISVLILVKVASFQPVLILHFHTLLLELSRPIIGSTSLFVLDVRRSERYL